MDIDKVKEVNEDTEMDYEEVCDNRNDANNYNDDDDDDEEENILFQNVPVQTNQNSSLYHAIPANKVYGSGQHHQNYIYQTLLFNKPISSNKKLLTDIVLFKKVDELVQSDNDLEPVPLAAMSDDEVLENFTYSLSYITDFREQVAIESNCEWLDCRLEVYTLLDDNNVSLDQMLSQLRLTLINVANDLMIYYHTDSEFALQLSRMESYNLLMLLKHPKLEMIILNLHDGFSDLLMQAIKDGKQLEKNGALIGVTLPSLVAKIMNNFAILDSRKQSLKMRYHNLPKVVFHSFYVPSYIVMNNDHINVILDKKIIALQRKYFCKVILDGPFLRSVSLNPKYDYYRLDIFFDYQFNYWSVVKRELLKWLSGFKRPAIICNSDNVCVSYATQNFFCCDEIQNIMKRQHLFREIDPNFGRLLKWVRVNQVDSSSL